MKRPSSSNATTAKSSKAASSGAAQEETMERPSSTTKSAKATSSGESFANKVKDPDQIAFHFYLLSGEVVSTTLAELQKMEGDYFFGPSQEKKQGEGKQVQERPLPKGVAFLF